MDRRLPVIPVLLPDAPARPELPLFLRAFTWVDLRIGLTDDGLDRLEWGITGVKPGKTDLPKKPQVSKPAGSSQSEPWMNLESELEAFKKIATGEDTQTRLINDLDDFLHLFPDHPQAKAMRDLLQQRLDEISSC